MLDKSDKKQILVESVQKLIALRVPEEEIITNLKEVGIGEEQARALIKLAKQPPKKTGAVEAEKPSVQSPKAEKPVETRAEEIAEALAQPTEKAVVEKPNANAKPVQEHVEEKKDFGGIASVSSTAKPVDISKLWEKGILSAVDQRLREMKKLKEELDKAISQKADEIAKKEIEKIQVLFDSQQKLFLEKANAQLEKKGKEVEELVDQKIVEMRKTTKELEKEMVELENKRSQYKDYLEEIDSKLKELDKTKGKLISEMNSELIKAKSSIQEFLDSSQAKLQEIDERVNKTLEVASSAIEGLKADALEQVQKVSVTRTDELNKEVLEEIEQMRETRLAFESQIKQRLAKLDELQDGVKKELSDVRSASGAQLKEALSDFENRIEQRLTQLDELQQAVQREFKPEVFKQQLSDLEVFKAQFIKVIEKNVDKFNKAIQQINQQAKAIETQINNRITLIDKKIKELDEFEKQFAEEMGIALEKVFEKKRVQKKKK